MCPAEEFRADPVQDQQGCMGDLLGQRLRVTHREERVGCAVYHQCRCGDLREPFAQRVAGRVGVDGGRSAGVPQVVADDEPAVFIEAPPPDGEPVALVLFGANQAAPAQIAARAVPRRRGSTGNRDRWRQPGTTASSRAASSPVSSPRQASPDCTIRVGNQSKDTWQNVALSLRHLREALALGLRLPVARWAVASVTLHRSLPTH